MTAAFTLGVIGHVDHGKTALVRALTGIETDRLREEQERGLSIALGFAYLETGHGTVDLIDVPGHESFVRTMIGGATGLDGVVLCIAANEGVMPQTVEHLNIARLLGLANGIVVITKTDLVGQEALARTRAQVRDFVRGTFLAGAPLVEVSARVGRGVEDVREAVGRCRLGPARRDPGGGCFLPLDRAFTVPGFGVVVTGTLRGGALRVGDTVEILPAGRMATVRGLEQHNRPIELAVPGQRVAVNLRHVSSAELGRGDVLAAPGLVRPAARFDGVLRLLEDSSAIRNGATLRLLTGTSEAMARVRLLDRQALEPGEKAMAQLTLDRAIATRLQEPYLVRMVSPVHTIGGGTVLGVDPPRHRRYDTGALERLRAVASGDSARIVGQRLAAAGARGVRLEDLAAELALDRAALRAAAKRAGAISIAGGHVVDAGALARLQSAMLEAVDSFHAASPLRQGIDFTALTRDRLADSRPDADVARFVLARLVEEGALSLHGQTVSRRDYDAFARLPESERELVLAMEQQCRSRGIEAVAQDALVGTSKRRQVISRLLLESGRLVRLRTYDRATQLLLHAESLEAAVRRIEQAFPYPADFAARDVRDLLGSTRRYVVPLLEHLDASGITVRNGDLRRLRQDLAEEVAETVCRR